MGGKLSWKTQLEKKWSSCLGLASSWDVPMSIYCKSSPISFELLGEVFYLLCACNNSFETTHSFCQSCQRRGFLKKKGLIDTSLLCLYYSLFRTWCLSRSIPSPPRQCKEQSKMKEKKHFWAKHFKRRIWLIVITLMQLGYRSFHLDLPLPLDIPPPFFLIKCHCYH